MKPLTNRIRQARRAADLSQADLAAIVGVQRSAVAQWERIDGSRPTTENLSKIALATSINFEWLATGRGRMKLRLEGDEDDSTPALLLQFFAQDELEERALMALRQLDYREMLAIVEMAEAMARIRTKA
ncbi:MAG TPA: helix-turn-helix transcriptional regulator [Arenimonas sp.]|uniref:helix-turn-helix transcriptional regulator n=1 Tax=Arenimonas sp. TaxID=1872635 RepID=UPI002B534E08|nr:helix-turn-helix transcriptional regulator [Arenimonas sp.]HMB56887.1 helix-turn-helix transcriptional regulator [Arenimonas sp.]